MNNSSNFVLTAKVRNELGKGASRRFRRSDMLPAVIYGSGKGSVSILLEHVKFAKSLENEAFYTHILTIKSDDGKEEQAVLKALQRHPYKPKILHADFQRVSSTEKITMNIPIHFKGETIAPGVKLKGGIVSHLLSEVEIRCFPQDLPEYIEVDLSQLDLDQTFHLSDLILPKGAEIAGLVAESSNDKAVASIHVPRAAEEAPVIAPSAAVETMAEAKAKAKAAEEQAEEGGKSKK